MHHPQENIPESKKDKNSRTLNFFHLLNFFFIATNFLLNFLGNPSLKYFYLIHVIFIMFMAFIYRIDQILPEILTFFFLEGQGRILWEYQGWSRVAFDITLVVAVTRVFIINKKFYDKRIIPLPIIILIACHFLWYTVQFSNIYAASFFGVAGALKVYVFPILLFLGFSQSDLLPEKEGFTSLLITFAAILVLELALNYYQMQLKQNFLYKISSYYYTATKNGIFTNLLFRPFATTQLPGALSVFIFLTVGFLYIRPLSWKMSFLRFPLILFSVFNLIICQVRSALIKYLLVLALIYVGKMIFQRLHPKKLLPQIIIILTALIVIQNVNWSFIHSNDINLSEAIERFTTLSDVGKIKSQRIDGDTFFTKVFAQVSEYPMGVGPGMTGAAASVNQEALAQDPILNSKSLWTHDNLFISLFIDLGIGAFFYIAMIFLIPIYFTKELISYYKSKDEKPFSQILACTSSLIVILIGNWGALGLTYNPESFIFWFFSALGFLIISRTKCAQTSTT